MTYFELNLTHYKLYDKKKLNMIFRINSCSFKAPHGEGCETRSNLGAGLRGNGERMRKWTENELMEREGGNEKRIRKWAENEEMDRE